ncbi:hypothetical protein C8R44DRAFT_880030 [Mycena epipterygia]|nr:hypothetical protein C8R44DRAFT_880030 [Mycena epipterygia]
MSARDIPSLAWRALFDKSIQLPTWLIQQVNSMTKDDVCNTSDAGISILHQTLYTSLVREAGTLPSGDLTSWRQAIADSNRNLADLVASLGLFVPSGATGRQVFGAALWLFHEVSGEDVVDTWVAKLVRPSTLIAKDHNARRLAVLNPGFVSIPHNSVVTRKILRGFAQLGSPVASPSSSVAQLTSVPGPSRVMPTASTSRDRPPAESLDSVSPPRKRARARSPSPETIAGPSRRPLTSLPAPPPQRSPLSQAATAGRAPRNDHDEDSHRYSNPYVAYDGSIHY